MWDVTHGKPPAASSEGMEGQDRIPINKGDVIGMKPRIMMVFWEYIFYKFYSFIFIRPVPFILIIFFNIFFLIYIILTPF